MNISKFRPKISQKFTENLVYNFQYDFSLETEVKEVFQRVEEENDRLQKLEIETENEPEPELKSEGPPPVPKRDFEKDPNGKKP